MLAGREATEERDGSGDGEEVAALLQLDNLYEKYRSILLKNNEGC